MDSNMSSTKIMILVCLIAAITSVGGCGGGGDSSTTPANQPQSPATPTPTQSAPLTPPERTLGAPVPVVSDSVILAQVTENLAAEEILVHSDIDVTATDGVVTLEGTVSDTDALLAAERAVSSIPGVASVDNNLVPLSCRIETNP